MFESRTLEGDKPAQYAQLLAQAEGLMHGEPDRIANAANLSALLFNALPDLNWAGFYFFDGNELVVGPFQGLPACVRIPLDKGVCGAAASTRETQRVDDVHAFPGGSGANHWKQILRSRRLASYAVRQPHRECPTRYH